MNTIKKFFVSDWKAKLIALISAIALWVAVTAFQSSVISIPGKIHIDFKNIKEGLSVVADNEDVQIKISSPNTNLNQITQDNFKANIDLSGLDAGTYVKPVTVTSKNPNIKIVSISPSDITLRIEEKINKIIPVRVRFDGSAAEGFGASDTKISPSQVTVSGPESIVNDITEAVAPVHLDSQNIDFSKSAQLFVYTASGSEIKNVDLNPSTAKVDVSITRVGETKTVGIKVNVMGNLAAGYWINSITTDPEVLNISGGASRVASTKFVETEPVDISNLNTTKTFTVKINLPEGIMLETKIPSVKVTLNVSRSDNVREIAVTPNFTNLKTGLSVSSTTPPKTLVVLSGSPEILNQVDSSNVDLNIDLSSYGAGTYDIQLTKDNLKFPSNLTFLGLNPDKISITIVRN